MVGEALKSELLDTNAMTLACVTRRRTRRAHRVVEGVRRDRLCVLHELRKREGGRFGAQSACLPAAVLGGARTTGARERPRVEDVPHRNPRFSVAAVPRVRSARGHRHKAARSAIAPRSKHDMRSWRQNAPAVRCRCRRFGAATAWRERIEFWQGRKSRLHDRLLYTKHAGTWVRSRLAP